jgi:hypothetical protein
MALLINGLLLNVIEVPIYSLTTKEGMMSSKQMKFSDNEQEQLTKAVVTISEILLNKLDEGRETAELEVENIIENENRKVVFNVIAQTIKP